MSFRSTSLIFIFSYLYFCTYIMSPIILLADKNIIGVHNDPKDYYLYISLVLSFFIYFFIILGYIRGGQKRVYVMRLNVVLNLKLFYLVTLCSICFFVYFYLDDIFARFFFHKAIDIFKVSDGNGAFILISGIYKYCFIFFIAYVFIKIKNDQVLCKFDIATICFFLFFLLLDGLILTSRRSIAVLFFSISFILALLYQKKMYILHAMVVILVLFFAPILQIIRYGLVYQGANVNSEIYSENTFGYIIYFFKQIHVSSFEGQWLAVFLEKISFRDFLFGVNFFEPIGNLLSYIPRFIWHSKPYDIGIIEIQKFLAPQSFVAITNSNMLQCKVTLPSTFIVELLYTTGIFGCLIFAYVIGYLFSKMENLFDNNQNNIIIVTLYFYVYLYMFDFVRGGSAFLVSLCVPLIILIVITRRIKNGD